LKGFQFRKEHLYTRPDLDDLMDDPVYQHYVKLDKKRAVKEKKRADDEKKRADKTESLLDDERKKSEIYRKKLLALGVNL